MSRSRKDIKKQYFKKYWKNDDKVRVECDPNSEYFGWGYYIQLPTTKPKLRKEVDTKHHWMTTPSWWNNLFHTKPIRGKFRKFAKTVVRASMESIEEMLEPSDSKKPHKYYW